MPIPHLKIRVFWIVFEYNMYVCLYSDHVPKAMESLQTVSVMPGLDVDADLLDPAEVLQVHLNCLF